MKTTYNTLSPSIKTAALTKLAKSYANMTETERKNADKALADYKKFLAKNTYTKRYKDPQPINTPDTLGGAIKLKGKRALKHLASLGVGTGTAVASTALRGADSFLDLLGWPIRLADDLVLGKLMGIDEGNGLLGRLSAKRRRKIDNLIHSVRDVSARYDHENAIDSKFNRFLNGPAADALGTFIGWGGVGGIVAGGLRNRLTARLGQKAVDSVGRTLSIGGAALGAGSTLMDEGILSSGREKQLRDREAAMRSIPWAVRQYMDPTATRYHIEHSPTKDEYRLYNMPYAPKGMVSPTGELRIPRGVNIRQDGMLSLFNK